MREAGIGCAEARALLEALLPIVHRAGAAVMEVYATGCDAQVKGDGTPVTVADYRSEALILAALRALTPGIPVVSEEAAASARPVQAGARFWLVDPLDGTAEFLRRYDEFTVNIGLVESGRPVLGVVLAPARGRLFAGCVPEARAFAEDGAVRTPIACRRPPAEGVTVVASRSHGDAKALEQLLAGRTVARCLGVGSALKFGLLASAEADLYPRLGRTMEWDTAAGHAVVLAAGGAVRTLDGGALQYGKPGYENPHFIASGRAPDPLAV